MEKKFALTGEALLRHYAACGIWHCEYCGRVFTQPDVFCGDCEVEEEREKKGIEAKIEGLLKKIDEEVNKAELADWDKVTACKKELFDLGPIAVNYLIDFTRCANRVVDDNGQLECECLVKSYKEAVARYSHKPN